MHYTVWIVVLLVVVHCFLHFSARVSISGWSGDVDAHSVLVLCALNSGGGGGVGQGCLLLATGDRGW